MDRGQREGRPAKFHYFLFSKNPNLPRSVEEQPWMGRRTGRSPRLQTISGRPKIKNKIFLRKIHTRHARSNKRKFPNKKIYTMQKLVPRTINYTGIARFL